MVNTILSGFLTVSMKVLDFFLAPISNYLANSPAGDNYLAFISNFNGLMNTLKGVLPWVVDLTGLPKPLFKLIFGTFLWGVGLRVGIYITKAILKWWDRIVA